MTARPRCRALLPTVAVVLVGCADEPASNAPAPVAYQLLANATDWSEVARDADPILDDPERAPECLGPDFFVENEWVEIDTGLCNWVTLEARARFEVAQGQQLRLVVSHYDLDALAPAEGVLRLQFGACMVWQKSVAIPNPAAVYAEELASPCSLEQGGPLLFHLHNHGQNTWQLQELAVLR